MSENDSPTMPPIPDPDDREAFMAWAAERQRAYEQSRKAWAKAIGYPYPPKRRRDPRPAPGTVDDGEYD
jgi:hypothetical protein